MMDHSNLLPCKDAYLIDGIQYQVIFKRPFYDFDPWENGFEPKTVKESSLFDYWCEFKICGGKLFLHELNIHNENEQYPCLNGVCPSLEITRDILEAEEYLVYKDIGLSMSYTGEVVLGAKPIHGPYLYHDKRMPCGYQKLLKLEFADGELTNTVDLSEAAAIQRQQIKQHPEEAHSILVGFRTKRAEIPEEYRKVLSPYSYRRNRGHAKKLRDILQEMDAQESNYVFYDNNSSVIKKNKQTNECFFLFPYDNKEGMLGWLRYPYDLSSHIEISEDVAKMRIRKEIEWLSDYCGKTLPEQSMQRLVHDILVGEWERFYFGFYSLD